MSQTTLVGIQVGQPKSYGSDDAEDPTQQTWTSSIAKTPITGPVWVGKTNLQGDQQADLSVHGGVDKAVLAYGAAHYLFWREELNLPDLPYGGFGENLTLDGSDETNVCLGDRYQLGSAILEVSQPRQPCWKLARRWQIKTLVKQALNSGRLGWYLRVIDEGEIVLGDMVELLERPYQQWTLSRLNEIMYSEKDNLTAAEELANCKTLAESWRVVLAERLQS